MAEALNVPQYGHSAHTRLHSFIQTLQKQYEKIGGPSEKSPALDFKIELLKIKKLERKTTKSSMKQTSYCERFDPDSIPGLVILFMAQ